MMNIYDAAHDHETMLTTKSAIRDPTWLAIHAASHNEIWAALRNTTRNSVRHATYDVTSFTILEEESHEARIPTQAVRKISDGI